MIGSLLITDFFPEALKLSRDVANSNIGGMQTLAMGLAAMLAGIAYISLMKRFIYGENVNGWEILRPILMVVIVANFNIFVLSPINSVMLSITGTMAQNTAVIDSGFKGHIGAVSAGYDAGKTKRKDDLSAAVMTLLGYGLDEGGEPQTSDDKPVSGFKKVWSHIVGKAVAVGNVVSNVFRVTEGAKMDLLLSAFGLLIAGLLEIVYSIIVMGMQYTCAVELTVLALVGPLVFAIGIISKYEAGIFKWIERYVELYMWAPVMYIVLTVTSSLERVLAPLLGNTAWLPGTATCIFIICNIIAISNVPKMASWVMEASGVGGTLDSLGGAAQKAAGTIAKAAAL